MGLSAGQLRHRVDIQLPQDTQDPASGAVIKTYVTQWFGVAARIEYLSVKELIAASAAQSKISARITLRYRAGYTADMRIVHGSKIFTPAGVLPDSDSGREYVVAPCSEGVVKV